MNKLMLWYFADPMCSWCWGFSPVIEAIRENYQDRLSVSLVMGGLRPKMREAVTPQLREEILHHWHEVHRRTGQPFLFEGAMPEGFVYDTEPACRAVVTVSEINARLNFPYLKRVHAAFYAEKKDVTNAEVLAVLAEELGIISNDFTQAFHSDRIKLKVREQFQQSMQWGIRGFPTLILQNKTEYRELTRGYQPLDQLSPILNRFFSALV